MEDIMKKVPDILTPKDLDYLSDLFNWNYLGYKIAYDCEQNSTDKDLKNLFKEVSNAFYNNLNTTLDILYEKGEENGKE